jgi:UDP-hydrolysing UDP-N-acetyl-D-glucosamine 2-epimerase
MDLLKKEELENILEWKFGEKTALFTYHPVTSVESDTDEDIEQIFNVLSQIDINVLFIYANADHNGRLINQKIEEFCQADPVRYKVVKNLGKFRYLHAMKYVDILLGNTSSGIIEAASFYKPVVNIGDRQKGRMQSGNVIQSDIDTLKDSISMALGKTFIEKCKSIQNIYGTGYAADIIVKTLEEEKALLRKKFIDVNR